MRIYKRIPKDSSYFKQRVKITKDGCWEWKLLKNYCGYGLVRVGSWAEGTRKQKLAHRESYRVFVGEFDSNLHVLHKCDNPPCINPEHLFLGTQRDNNFDSRDKGRRYSKLKDQQVLDIRRRLTEGERGIDLSKEYGVTPPQISAIKVRRQWIHI